MYFPSLHCNKVVYPLIKLEPTGEFISEKKIYGFKVYRDFQTLIQFLPNGDMELMLKIILFLPNGDIELKVKESCIF